LYDQILPPGTDRADRAAWLAVRQTGIGGSDVSTLLGMNKRRSVRDLWEDKTGRQTDDEPAGEAAEWGTLLEPIVREEFTRRIGIAVTPVGMLRSREHEFMLYNADGLTSDGGIYEGKTASLWKRNEWGDDQIPDHAELQVQHGMAVMGVGHAWVVGLIGGQKLVWKRIERDPELIGMIVMAEEKFWNVNVLLDVPPELDGSEASERYVNERYPLADPSKIVEVDPWTSDRLRSAYRKAAANKKADVEAFVAAQNAMRDLLGDAEVAQCGGKVIATWTNNGSAFDEAAFRAAHPELADEYTATVEVQQLDRKRLAVDHPDVYRTFRNRVLRVKA
jgi:putative phage-type endonuclease